jgi:hypothetical protein
MNHNEKSYSGGEDFGRGGEHVGLTMQTSARKGNPSSAGTRSGINSRLVSGNLRLRVVKHGGLYRPVSHAMACPRITDTGTLETDAAMPTTEGKRVELLHQINAAVNRLRVEATINVTPVVRRKHKPIKFSCGLGDKLRPVYDRKTGITKLTNALDGYAAYLKSCRNKKMHALKGNTSFLADLFGGGSKRIEYEPVTCEGGLKQGTEPFSSPLPASFQTEGDDEFEFSLDTLNTGVSDVITLSSEVYIAPKPLKSSDPPTDHWDNVNLKSFDLMEEIREFLTTPGERPIDYEPIFALNTHWKKEPVEKPTYRVREAWEPKPGYGDEPSKPFYSFMFPPGETPPNSSSSSSSETSSSSSTDLEPQAPDRGSFYDPGFESDTLTSMSEDQYDDTLTSASDEEEDEPESSADLEQNPNRPIPRWVLERDRAMQMTHRQKFRTTKHLTLGQIQVMATNAHMNSILHGDPLTEAANKPTPKRRNVCAPGCSCHVLVGRPSKATVIGSDLLVEEVDPVLVKVEDYLYPQKFRLNGLELIKKSKKKTVAQQKAKASSVNKSEKLIARQLREEAARRKGEEDAEEAILKAAVERAEEERKDEVFMQSLLENDMHHPHYVPLTFGSIIPSEYDCSDEQVIEANKARYESYLELRLLAEKDFARVEEEQPTESAEPDKEPPSELEKAETAYKLLELEGKMEVLEEDKRGRLAMKEHPLILKQTFAEWLSDEKKSEETEAESCRRNLLTKVFHSKQSQIAFTDEWDVCPLPSEEWDKYIDYDYQHNVMSYIKTSFGATAWNMHENVSTVRLIYVPYYYGAVADYRPIRDKLDPFVDDQVVLCQPLIKITLIKPMNNGVTMYYKASDLRYLDGLHDDLKFDRRSLGTCTRNSFISTFRSWLTPLQTPLEVKESQIFSRINLERYDTRWDASGLLAQRYVFETQCISSFMLNELLSRQVVLTPKMSATIAVERVVRKYSEDSFSNSYSTWKLHNRSVLVATVNLAVASVTKNMTTAISDF